MEKSNQNYIVLTQEASSRNSGGWAASCVWEQGHARAAWRQTGGRCLQEREVSRGLPPLLQLLCISSTAGPGQNQTDRLGHKHLSVSAPSEGFFGLPSTAWMSGCLFVLLLGLKKKKTCFILIPRIASKTNNTWYSCGTSEHTCTFIYIHPWRLTLSLKGVLLFHPCFIDEETKIRKTCSQFIQLRALNQLVGFCIPEVTLPTVSWKDAIPIN